MAFTRVLNGKIEAALPALCTIQDPTLLSTQIFTWRKDLSLGKILYGAIRTVDNVPFEI